MRILHCPHNIAGQAWEYAESLRQLGHEAAVWTMTPHRFGYESDRCLYAPGDSARVQSLGRRLLATCAAARFDPIVRTAQCSGGPSCGNNIKEGIEVCDGTDVGGKTCRDVDTAFAGGIPWHINTALKRK
jgi:hypothetical protein